MIIYSKNYFMFPTSLTRRNALAFIINDAKKNVLGNSTVYQGEIKYYTGFEYDLESFDSQDILILVYPELRLSTGGSGFELEILDSNIYYEYLKSKKYFIYSSVQHKFMNRYEESITSIFNK